MNRTATDAYDHLSFIHLKFVRDVELLLALMSENANNCDAFNAMKEERYATFPGGGADKAL